MMIAENETEEDNITIINPSQPYTFKDGQYMVIGTPMNQIQVPDIDESYHDQSMDTTKPIQQQPIYIPYSMPSQQPM